MATSVEDARLTLLRSVSGLSLGSIADAEFAYYSANSGLGLGAARSLRDHKIAFYALKGFSGNTVSGAEVAYFRNCGATGMYNSDVRSDFYHNHTFV